MPTPDITGPRDNEWSRLWNQLVEFSESYRLAHGHNPSEAARADAIYTFDWIEEVRAAAWRAGRESMAADMARPLDETGMRPSTPNPHLPSAVAPAPAAVSGPSFPEPNPSADGWRPPLGTMRQCADTTCDFMVRFVALGWSHVDTHGASIQHVARPRRLAIDPQLPGDPSVDRFEVVFVDDIGDRTSEGFFPTREAADQDIDRRHRALTGTLYFMGWEVVEHPEAPAPPSPLPQRMPTGNPNFW